MFFTNFITNFTKFIISFQLAFFTEEDESSSMIKSIISLGGQGTKCLLVFEKTINNFRLDYKL